MAPPRPRLRSPSCADQAQSLIPRNDRANLPPRIRTPLRSSTADCEVNRTAFSCACECSNNVAKHAAVQHHATHIVTHPSLTANRVPVSIGRYRSWIVIWIIRSRHCDNHTNLSDSARPIVIKVVRVGVVSRATWLRDRLGFLFDVARQIITINYQSMLCGSINVVDSAGVTPAVLSSSG